LNISVIKQQGKNYFSVLRWLLSDYHRKEKAAFWLVQVLMAISVGLGLIWLLGVIAGINHLNDRSYLTSINLNWLTYFFDLPVWQWMMMLSLSGMISAAAMFASFHAGVKSVIRYQINLVNRLLDRINDAEHSDWLTVVEDQPKEKVHRIIKLSVQLTGLVVRRLSRMLIPIVTFMVAFVALIQLDAALLSHLIPLAGLYIVALYFINRHAARVQVSLANMSVPTNRNLGVIINDMLQRNRQYDQHIEQEVVATDYPEFSLLRYKRRLAEVHVVWLNTLFLVLGTAIIFFSFDHYQNNGKIDWMQLILFLVALRYAGSGLQEIAAATVSFSRFLPETELVYQMLKAPTDAQRSQSEKWTGRVMYLNTDAGMDAVIPVFLDLQFGVRNCEKLTEQVRNGDVDLSGYPDNIWLYSEGPAQFKQAVRNNRKALDHVVYTHLGSHVHYDDIGLFLQEFLPAQFKQTNNQSQDDFDESMI